MPLTLSRDIVQPDDDTRLAQREEEVTAILIRATCGRLRHLIESLGVAVPLPDSDSWAARILVPDLATATRALELRRAPVGRSTRRWDAFRWQPMRLCPRSDATPPTGERRQRMSDIALPWSSTAVNSTAISGASAAPGATTSSSTVSGQGQAVGPVARFSRTGIDKPPVVGWRTEPVATYAAVGWPTGRRSHAVLKAGGAMRISCLHLPVPADAEFSNEPLVDRVCRHHNCVEQLDAWRLHRELAGDATQGEGAAP